MANSIMFQAIIILVLVSTLSAFPGQDDEVILLPGLRFQPSFKHYSGYLNGSSTRKLHYWFVESQMSPQIDPLVLWLNGGPGCSSLIGFITENGPFQVTPEGYLVPNPYSWNRIANIIYLESPSCVGFSYSTDGKCDASDDSTSLLNYNALEHFLVKFPQFKGRDFYITGESYGGIYIPTLSVRIVSSKSLTVKFRGIAVGNGALSSSINANGNFHFAYNHGLISDSLWSDILALCCSGHDSSHCDITGNKEVHCQAKIRQAKEGFGKLNPYNIYSDCYTPPNSKMDVIWTRLGVNTNYEKSQILSLGHSDPMDRIFKLREQYRLAISTLQIFGWRDSNDSGLPCIDGRPSTKFLNNPKLRYALHIPDAAPQWSSCSENPTFKYTRNYENMTSQYNALFHLADFKIWIYNGDTDMVCSYLGDEWFFQNFNRKVMVKRKPWLYKDANNSQQIGGYVKVWDKFVLITVRGSGHMVPTDKPIPAYKIFESFIYGKPL